jgi:drug/metabolite transporter (DMT)-like permease
MALQYISATRYALFQPSIPVWGTLVSVLIGAESLTAFKAAGIVCAGIK